MLQRLQRKLNSKLIKVIINNRTHNKFVIIDKSTSFYEAIEIRFVKRFGIKLALNKNINVLCINNNTIVFLGLLIKRKEKQASLRKSISLRGRMWPNRGISNFRSSLLYLRLR